MHQKGPLGPVDIGIHAVGGRTTSAPPVFKIESISNEIEIHSQAWTMQCSVAHQADQEGCTYYMYTHW